MMVEWYTKVWPRIPPSATTPNVKGQAVIYVRYRHIEGSYMQWRTEAS